MKGWALLGGVGLLLMTLPDVHAELDAAGIPSNNALYIDSSHNPMNQPGGFLVNGTSVSLYVFNLGASVTTVKLLDPLDSLTATAVPSNGQAVMVGVSMTREGTWSLADQLLNTITRFNVQLWVQGESVTVANNTATLFADMINFTRDVTDLFDATPFGLTPPDAGDVSAIGGLPPDQVVTCDATDISTINVDTFAFVPMRIDLFTSSMGPADSAYALLYVEEVGGFHRPSGAILVPSAPGDNGSEEGLAQVLMFENLSYTGLLRGQVFPEADSCTDTDTWQAV